MTNEDIYVQNVWILVASNPTGADLNKLVEAHVRLGNFTAKAESLADEAEAARRKAVAEAYLAAKQGETKVSDRQAEAMAEIAAWPHRQAEVAAKTQARKLRNLFDSIEQAINAIKFLGRYDSVSLPH